MEVRKIKVGYLQTNCYVLIEDGKSLIIDPGDQFYSIEDQIKDSELIGILITHNHPDHIGALDKFIKTYNIPFFDRNNLNEGSTQLGPFNFEVIYTPGHTNDSISFLFYQYNFMFSGDFIFLGSIGRTDMPTGSDEDMKQSLLKISNYSDKIKIYPGHGDATSLGNEKMNNPFFSNL